MTLPKTLGLSLLVSLAGTGYVLYPLALHLWTRRRADEEPGQPKEPGQAEARFLSVVVPAFREDAVIAAKVNDLGANGYRGRLEIIVVADDVPTADAAEATGARVIRSEHRLGKAEALNRGILVAAADIVAISDANTLLRKGSLAALARWFVDPSVGAVAGEKSVSAEAEGAYWRFESWLKRREARTGSTFALVGELAAVRKDVFTPLPPDLAVEDLWLALDVLEAGYRIAYEPDAIAVEDASASWRDDWERRTRVVSGVLDVLWRRRWLLLPTHGALAVQLWGHRLVRSSLGPVAHLLILLIAAAKWRVAPEARVTLCAHAVGLVAAVRTQRRVRQTALERVIGQALFLQAVALGGLVRYLRGDRPALWAKPPRPPHKPFRSFQRSSAEGE